MCAEAPRILSPEVIASLRSSRGSGKLARDRLQILTGSVFWGRGHRLVRRFKIKPCDSALSTRESWAGGVGCMLNMSKTLDSIPSMQSQGGTQSENMC